MRGDPETVARVLDLKRHGAEWKGSCPLCGGNDRFHVRAGKQREIILHCRQGCAFRDLAAALTALGVVEDDRARFEEFADDLDEMRAFLRAFQASIAERKPVSSREKALARRAIWRITGYSVDEFVEAWIWLQISRAEMPETIADAQRQADLARLIDPHDWMAKGAAWLI